jgi:anti-anti-sigma factor
MGANGFDADTITDAAFTCAVQRRGRTSEILLEGELDLAAKPALDEAIVTALAPGPPETVIVDLTRVTFADSTTITWLVMADTTTAALGGRLIAVAVPGPVIEVLQMTGADERLTLVAAGRVR